MSMQFAKSKIGIGLTATAMALSIASVSSVDAYAASDVKSKDLAVLGYDMDELVDGYVKIKAVDDYGSPLSGVVYGLYDVHDNLIDTRMSVDDGIVYFPVEGKKTYYVKEVSTPDSIEPSGFNDKFKLKTTTDGKYKKVYTDSHVAYSVIATTAGIYDLDRSELTLSDKKYDDTLSIDILKIDDTGEAVSFGNSALDVKYVNVRVDGAIMPLTDLGAYLENEKSNDVESVEIRIDNPNTDYTYMLNGKELTSKNDFEREVKLDDKILFTMTIPYDAYNGLSGELNTAPNVSGEVVEVKFEDVTIEPKVSAKVHTLSVLSSGASNLLNSILSSAKYMEQGKTSSEYAVMESDLIKNLTRLSHMYEVEQPFSSCGYLNMVYPYGVASNQYGYTKALDADGDGYACEQDSTTPQNVNLSVFRLAYNDAKQAETNGSGSNVVTPPTDIVDDAVTDITVSDDSDTADAVDIFDDMSDDIVTDGATSKGSSDTTAPEIVVPDNTTPATVQTASIDEDSPDTTYDAEPDAGLSEVDALDNTDISEDSPDTGDDDVFDDTSSGDDSSDSGDYDDGSTVSDYEDSDSSDSDDFDDSSDSDDVYEDDVMDDDSDVLDDDTDSSKASEILPQTGISSNMPMGAMGGFMFAFMTGLFKLRKRNRHM